MDTSSQETEGWQGSQGSMEVLDTSSQAAEVCQGFQDSVEVSEVAQDSKDSSEDLESFFQAPESIISRGIPTLWSGGKE